MEIADKALQQKPGDPGTALRRDNLYEAREDALRGSQNVAARGSSLALQAQKLPRSVLAFGLLGAGAAIAGGLILRKRR